MGSQNGGNEYEGGLDVRQRTDLHVVINNVYAPLWLLEGGGAYLIMPCTMQLSVMKKPQRWLRED